WQRSNELLLNSADRGLSPGAVLLLPEFNARYYFHSEGLSFVSNARQRVRRHSRLRRIPLNFQKALGRSMRHFCCRGAQGWRKSPSFEKSGGLSILHFSNVLSIGAVARGRWADAAQIFGGLHKPGGLKLALHAVGLHGRGAQRAEVARGVES